MSALIDLIAGSTITAVIGIAAVLIGIVVSVVAMVAPGRARIARSRRRPNSEPSPSPLAGAAQLATAIMDKALQSERAGGLENYLERAGVKAAPQDLALLVVVAALVAGALGFAIGGLLLAILFTALVPLGTKLFLDFKTKRRQKAFAGQLDDSLQLMASNLRAGHSLQQALQSVAKEAEEPTSDEFFRAINASRVGRDLTAALEETAVRMDSQDFVWVTQAISINREVGGNLADVLDGVSNTIRERDQIRRQVKSLSAEGKLSAIVLMALPVGIVLFLSMTNPGYIGRFLDGIVGYALIGLCVVLLGVGSLWLKKVVQIKF